MALLMMAVVQSASAAMLVYNFKNVHPSSQIRIDQGYKEVIDGYAYWTGAWAGLFGRKIAFATDSYPVLHQNGGLVDYHPSRKMYIMNVSVGDHISVVYRGNNAKVSYHTSGGAALQGMNLYDKLTSATSYTVTTAGNLCLLTHWAQGSDETFIDSIIIETASDTESVNVSEGMSTFCSKVPLDFSSSSTLKAYVATGFDNGKFIFKQVNYVPSNTGCLIVSTGGTSSTATVPVGRSADYKQNAVSTNLFLGCLNATNITIPSGKDGYAFGVADGEVGIFKISSGYRCAAQKAVLLVNR